MSGITPTTNEKLLLARFWAGLLVNFRIIKQRTHRRSFQIIELTLARRPDKGGHKASADAQSQRQDQVEQVQRGRKG